MIAFALLLAASTPQARKTGTVVYATQSRLYLDAGTRDGLAAGQVLKLRRDGRPAGSCTVESAGETRSTCAGRGIAGDVFDVSPPPPAPAPEVKRPPPPEATKVIEQRNADVVSAPFERVDFRAGPEFGGPMRAEVAVAHGTWAAAGAGPWHQERADVLLRDAPLFAGFTLDVDMSARRWSLRSDPVSFRPEDPAQLYVWEAAVSRNPRDGGFAMSVGRVRPQFMPGQIIFDGAQAGLRTAGGTEAGVFGGAVPDDVTLAPSLQHGTFGAYWAGQHAGAADSVLRNIRHEVRVAFVNTASLGKRIEGEGLLQLWLTKRFDAAANVRVGAGDHDSPNHLDAVRVDGNAQPFDSLSFTGGFRYEGLSLPELDGPGNVRFGGAARHADLSAQWDPADHLRISAISGIATDLTLNETRRFIGPELAAPNLVGGGAAVAAGYLEEQGWSKGRSSYVQVMAGQRSRFQVLARFSWFHSIYGSSPEPTDDLAVFASVRAQLSQAISLRVSAAGRSSLNGGRTAIAAPATQSGWLDGALAGQF